MEYPGQDTITPQPVEKTSWKQKVVIVLLFIIVPFALTYWSFILTDSLDSLELGAALLPVFSGIVGLVVGLLSVIIVRRPKALWLTAIIIIGLYGLFMDGVPIAKNTYYGTMNRLRDRKAKQVEAVTSVAGCETAVNSWLLTRYTGFIPSYYDWSKCMYRNFTSETDYSTCLKQASDKQDYYHHVLADDCKGGLATVQAQSLNDCVPLYPGDLSSPPPNGYNRCLKRFVIDKKSFLQCLSLTTATPINPFSTSRMTNIQRYGGTDIVTDNGEKYTQFKNRFLPCFEDYAAVSHDANICPFLYVTNFETGDQLSGLCSGGTSFRHDNPELFFQK